MRVVQTVGGFFSSAGCLRCASVSMHIFEWPAACANSPALGRTACTSSSALPSGAPPLGRPVRFSDHTGPRAAPVAGLVLRRRRATTAKPRRVKESGSDPAGARGAPSPPPVASSRLLSSHTSWLAALRQRPDGWVVWVTTLDHATARAAMKIDGAAVWCHVCNYARNHSYMHDTVTPVTAPFAT